MNFLLIIITIFHKNSKQRLHDRHATTISGNKWAVSRIRERRESPTTSGCMGWRWCPTTTGLGCSGSASTKRRSWMGQSELQWPNNVPSRCVSRLWPTELQQLFTQSTDVLDLSASRPVHPHRTLSSARNVQSVSASVLNLSVRQFFHFDFFEYRLSTFDSCFSRYVPRNYFRTSQKNVKLPENRTNSIWRNKKKPFNFFFLSVLLFCRSLCGFI